MTLFHSSTVSIYLGFHVSIRTVSIYNSYFCMNKMVKKISGDVTSKDFNFVEVW